MALLQAFTDFSQIGRMNSVSLLLLRWLPLTHGARWPLYGSGKHPESPLVSYNKNLSPIRGEKEHLVSARWGQKSKLPMWFSLTLRQDSLLSPSRDKCPGLHVISVFCNVTLAWGLWLHQYSLARVEVQAFHSAFAGWDHSLFCGIWMEQSGYLTIICLPRLPLS